MNYALLSKLTLVIPTYNRQSYALRNMRYWSGHGATVHVMDGSLSAIESSKLVGLGGNIHYHHLPISFYERIDRSLGLIETKYTAMMGDDEFFIPSALEACISELESQADLVSCIGCSITFNCTPKEVTGQFVYSAMKENFFFLQDDPVDRMVSHMSPYAPATIYSIVRTPVWHRSMSAVVKKEFPAFAIGELQFELAVNYQGKSKAIPVLMWLRSAEMPGIRGTDRSLILENDIVKWWLDSTKEAERSEFLAIMGTTLAVNRNAAADIGISVQNAVDVYVQGRLNSPTNHIIRITPYLPRPLKNILKLILRPFSKWLYGTGIRIDKPLQKAAGDLADTGVIVDFEELSKIQSIVSEFHAGMGIE